MLNEYLNRIQVIIADLRARLGSGNLPPEVADQIRAYLERMERLAEQYKEP